MSELDSWAAGVPVLMTRYCNLPEGFAAGAAIECGDTPGAIVPGLEQALAMAAPEWHQMTRAAHELASGSFSAPVIAARWAQAYHDAMTQRAKR